MEWYATDTGCKMIRGLRRGISVNNHHLIYHIHQSWKMLKPPRWLIVYDSTQQPLKQPMKSTQTRPQNRYKCSLFLETSYAQNFAQSEISKCYYHQSIWKTSVFIHPHICKIETLDILIKQITSKDVVWDNFVLQAVKCNIRFQKKSEQYFVRENTVRHKLVANHNPTCWWPPQIWPFYFLMSWRHHYF